MNQIMKGNVRVDVDCPLVQQSVAVFQYDRSPFLSSFFSTTLPERTITIIKAERIRMRGERGGVNVYVCLYVCECVYYCCGCFM